MDPILIVDDEKDNLEALRRQLRNQYDVSVADSAFEAVKLMQKSPFNVIISDQRMPDMTGVELLEKAKNLCPNTTRVLLTGYTDIESVIDAINRGNVYRYIAKPWDPEDLNLTVRQANEACLLRRELEQKNVALCKSNEELKKALDELQVLDRAKARFLGLVSHELNTPLTVLSSFVGLVSERQDTMPEELGKAISSISKASDRLSDIVKEVLTFVRLESDTQLALTKVNLEKLALEVIKGLEEERRKKQVVFQLKAISNAVVNADQEKLRLAVWFLLRDAIVRSRQNGNIKIDITRKPDGLALAVARGGEALSAGGFSPLETSGPLMHHQQNLGLSLAICKLITDRHKAKIDLESSDETVTVISVLFPSA